MSERKLYFFGLDLGQAQDYTALSVIEHPDKPRGEQPPEPPTLTVPLLHRYKTQHALPGDRARRVLPALESAGGNEPRH